MQVRTELRKLILVASLVLALAPTGGTLCPSSAATEGSPPTYTELLKNYREIRRKYRTLEFLSLGIILLAAAGAVSFALYARSKSASEAAEEPLVYEPIELSNRADCAKHLDNLMKRGTQLTSTQEDKSSETSVSAVHEEEGTFKVEMLTFPVNPGDVIRFDYIYDEIPYTFSAKVKDKTAEGEVTLEIPLFIKYTQRRKEARVRPSPLEQATALTENGLSIRILDISTSGISLLMDDDAEVPETFTLTIQLPGQRRWKVPAKRIYKLSITSGGKKKLRTGWCFTESPAGLTRDIRNYALKTRRPGSE